MFHYYRIYMNYNQINRNSLMSNLYSDRPAYQYPQSNEPWRNNLNEQPHLNPSKSKVNVRQSLNKTTEHYPSPNATIASIRNSCLFTNSQSTHNVPKQDNFLEDKCFSSLKENKDPSFTPQNKDHFPRYSQVSQPPLPGEQRRKSESAHFRNISNNDILFNIENDLKSFDIEKIEPPVKI